jgi:hypothetical protein
LLTELHAFRQPRAEAQGGTRRVPVHAARRPGGQRRGKRVGFFARETALVGVAEVGNGHRLREPAQQERTHAGKRNGAVALAQRIVIELRKHVAFLDAGAEAVEERMLRAVLHDPVRAGNEKLCGHHDRRGVRHDALRNVVEAEQHANRNRARDERIGIVACDPVRIAGQELRLHVARDEEVAAQLVHQRKSLACERDVQLDLERRRGEHHAAQSRRVIVDPRRDQHGAHALRDDAEIFGSETVRGSNVVDERLHVAHRRRDAWRIAAGAGRAAVTARVPGEEIEIGQAELVDEMRHAAGVLVPAMEEQDRAARRPVGRRPVAIEKIDAVVGAERPLLPRAREDRNVCGVVHVSCSTAPRNKRVGRALARRDHPVGLKSDLQGTASAGISSYLPSASPPRTRL